MNITWALVTPSKRLVITDSSFRKLKLIQMLVARHVMLDVVSWSNHPTVNETESELHTKIKFIKGVIDAEDLNIANLYVHRNNDGLKLTLNSVKEFYSLIYPEDTDIQDLVDLELTEIDSWKSAPVQHKSFVVQALHQIDYQLGLDAVKTSFRQLIKNPPHDDYYVYEALNNSLVAFLNTQDELH